MTRNHELKQSFSPLRLHLSGHLVTTTGNETKTSRPVLFRSYCVKGSDEHGRPSVLMISVGRFLEWL